MDKTRTKMNKLTPNSPYPIRLITHWAHSSHSLVLTTTGNTFICDFCRRDGYGLRYRCPYCDFDLHEGCATCPQIITSFAHPQHVITLRCPPPRHVDACGVGKPVCDICRYPIDGMNYCCPPCGFYLHPLCSLLPPVVAGSVFHPQHVLTLTFVPAVMLPCSACRHNCMVWRYRCDICRIDLHPGCLHTAKCIVAPWG